MTCMSKILKKGLPGAMLMGEFVGVSFSILYKSQ